MNQQEAIKKMKENEQQAKQFNVVAELINEALKKEMHVFMKLVQFDVLTEIQKKAIADGLKRSNSSEKQFNDTLDEMLGQINKDLKDQIFKSCEKLKQQ